MNYKEGNIEEIQQLKTMGHVLWPTSSEEELEKSFQNTFEDPNKVTIVCQSKTSELAGFSILSIRSDQVEGATSSPVGYLEGIFVYPGYRKQEVGRHLLEIGENWCRDQGCTQMGSDTSITNTDSTEFHLHVGFKVTEKNTCFIKDL